MKKLNTFIAAVFALGLGSCAQDPFEDVVVLSKITKPEFIFFDETTIIDSYYEEVLPSGQYHFLEYRGWKIIADTAYEYEKEWFESLTRSLATAQTLFTDEFFAFAREKTYIFFTKSEGTWGHIRINEINGEKSIVLSIRDVPADRMVIHEFGHIYYERRATPKFETGKEQKQVRFLADSLFETSGRKAWLPYNDSNGSEAVHEWLAELVYFYCTNPAELQRRDPAGYDFHHANILADSARVHKED